MADEDWAKTVQAHMDSLKMGTVPTASGDNIQSNGGLPTDQIVDQIDPAKESLLSKILASKLQEVSTKVKLEVLQRDPSNPLFSARSFEELPLRDELKHGLRDMGFMKPSRIQETALPLLLSDKKENMIAQSQSGTGKTAAFSLTVLSRIDTSQQYPQALILAPTYELALQIGLVVDKMGKFLGQNMIAYAVKGNRIDRGTKIAQPIIIGTPGTVLDWLTKLRAFDAKQVKIMVFDEADVMISTQGHKDQSIRIKRALPPSGTQMLLFSATYEEHVLSFAKSIIRDANIITLRREEESLTNINQFFVRARSDQDKIQALFNIYNILGTGQAMIFCRTRKTAQYVAKTMNEKGFAVALLTGQLEVTERARVIRRFQQGLERVLVSTNVTARGIDVEQVTLVINYDLPDQKLENFDTNQVENKFIVDNETYLHRIGRTGRFGKLGIAINMVANDRDMRMLKEIEAHFKRPVQALDANDIDDLENKLNEFE